MSRIGRSEISQGEILSVDEVLARTDAVTPEDAGRVARRVLAQPMALAVIGPFQRKDFAEMGGDLNVPAEASLGAAAHTSGAK
jgi:predicted Zn-dependent peptidase